MIFLRKNFCLVPNCFFRCHYETREQGHFLPTCEFIDSKRAKQIFIRFLINLRSVRKIRLSERNSVKGTWIDRTRRLPKGYVSTIRGIIILLIFFVSNTYSFQSEVFFVHRIYCGLVCNPF